MKVPVMTFVNTHPDFAWLVTYIETVLSTELWGTITAATTAYQYLTLCNRFADETVGNRQHVMFQCHDFSARGMIGRHAGALTGLGHLASFSGTDTIAAIDLVEDYYNEDASTYFIAGSVPASEHSVTSLGSSVDGEFETIRRWITECYPTGIVSVVSDTYDYWKVITEYLPAMKDEIVGRKPNALGLAKVVVRPDSGDPVRIIAGYREDEVYRNNGRTTVKAPQAFLEFDITEDEFKGSIAVLAEKFGYTVNALGYKELPPYIGLIYGDSITLDRAREIFSRLQQKGFASNNVVFGVGSYTYQHVTRDTLGIAVKATWAMVNGQEKELFKDPKTDNGTKKSARGLLRVENEGGKFVLYDQQTVEQEAEGVLRVVFEDGHLLVDEKFSTIRNRVHDIPEPEEEKA
jgi:nicotinamide phosphoribosyltransferase